MFKVKNGMSSRYSLHCRFVPSIVLHTQLRVENELSFPFLSLKYNPTFL